MKFGLTAGLDSALRNVTASDQVERLAKAPLAYQPRTAWEYSLAGSTFGSVVAAGGQPPAATRANDRSTKPRDRAPLDDAFWCSVLHTASHGPCAR